MVRLLIPVDFTIPSHNAYHYGLQLAAALNMDVVLVHYFTGVTNSEQPLTFRGNGSIHDSVLERLEHFAHPSGDGLLYPLVGPPSGVTVTYETSISLSPSTDIIKRADREDIHMVVMAPRSRQKWLGKWLGSVATTVSEASRCPVLLVPPGAEFHPFKRLVVANNHETADPYPLWQIGIMANIFRGTVDFVHIDQPDGEEHNRFVPWRLMEELVDKEQEKPYPFSVVAVEDEDIRAGLLQYAEQVRADLVVVVNRVRSRWLALVKTTLTQELALSSPRPLLVLHTDPDGAAEELVVAYEQE